MESILQLDQRIFLFFNGLHVDWLDPIVIWASNEIVWYPAYALIIWLIFRTYQNWRLSALTVVLIILAVISADSFTSRVMKPYFKRPRPTHELAIKDQVHTVYGYRGGQYGFASSHAANTFAFAMLAWLLFRGYWRYAGWFFAWAISIAYTRMYLGVHYPLDLATGALVGVLFALLFYQVILWLRHRFALQPVG